MALTVGRAPFLPAVLSIDRRSKRGVLAQSPRLDRGLEKSGHFAVVNFHHPVEYLGAARAKIARVCRAIELDHDATAEHRRLHLSLFCPLCTRHARKPALSLGSGEWQD